MSLIPLLRRTMPSLTPSFNPSEEEMESLRRLIQSPPILRRLTTPEPPEIPSGTIDEPPPVLTRSPASPEPGSPLLESLLSRQPSQVDVGPAPPMIIRRDGRPTNRFIGDGDPLERSEVRRRALSEYEPKNESKKHLVLRTLLNFVGGGIPGGAQTLIGQGGILDRKALDRNWQQNELAKENQSIQGLRLDRRAGMQDELMRSQIEENRAQAIRAGREPLAPSLVDYGGYQIPQTEAARLAQQRALAEGKPVAKRRYTIGNQIVEEQPDGSLKPVFTGAAKPEKPEADSGTLSSWYYKKQSEAEANAKALRDQADLITVGVDASGYPDKNAELQKSDLLRRASEAEKAAQDYRDKGDVEATKPKRATSRVQTFKPARDGKYHYTPEQIRASLQPGQTYEEIYAKLKANPKVAIDEQ